MNDVFAYLNWRGDLSFAQDPPNSVDALIFSALSYIRFFDQGGYVFAEPITLNVAAELFLQEESVEHRVRVKKDLELLKCAGSSGRFGNCRLVKYRDLYIPEQETQFAALGFLLDDGSAFVAFRGTDETLIGWKEDFNMSFQQTVPAQRLALDYLREFAMEYSVPLRLGGHSKGGNLAVFAASRCGPLIQEHILEVYNNDGPGFTEYMMGDPGYLSMVPRIHTFVPQSSVIGMLLEHEEPYTVIKSHQVSLLQHEIYSWEVLGKNFIPMEEITADSRFLNLTIKHWVSGMTNAERSVLVDALFGVLASGDIKTAADIFHPRNIRHYIKTINENGSIQKIFSGEFQNLIAAAKRAGSQFEEENRLEESQDNS